MIKTIKLSAYPEEVADNEVLKYYLKRTFGFNGEEIRGFRFIKRSIDARRKPIKVNIELDVYLSENVPRLEFQFDFKNVSNAKPVIIIGAGPAGLFAALQLLEKSIKPIIFERGKDVKARRRDLAALIREGFVNPDSNYCFGEGGAGTYSDGKLYTRSSKRGDIKRILQLFFYHGADETILYESHPHIGTNKLPGIISNMRATILSCGGEIHFNSRVTDILLESGSLTGVRLADGSACKSKALILATGHSARDIFELLHSKNILIESKPFALGVRVEHPQELIDRIQYKCFDKRDNFLPPSSYSLVEQVTGKGVFSFCMCPGGIIAPAMTNPGEIVVNGWSPSKRNNPFANSGIVVSIEEKEYSKYSKYGPLAAMAFQASVEKRCFEMGDQTLKAPAQRLVDFVNGKYSSQLPDCSYLPGIISRDIKDILPGIVTLSLKEAFKAFGKRMKGYFSNEAVIVATESRTSSPVRIPRNKETLEHVEINGLFPCGEGAGYAGGIVSAAMDGENCALKAAAFVNR